MSASRQMAQFSMRSRMISRSGSTPVPASGMAGGGRQMPGVYTDPAQRPLVFELDRRVEDERRVGRAIQPTIMLDFRFELAGGPARIAEREDSPVGSRPLGDSAQNVHRGGQRHAIVDRQGRIVDEVIGGVK